MKKAASFALGCKVNQYESEAIAELFQEKGYEIVGIDEEADVYVINTCTVTNFGDKKSRQLIRKVKRQNENAIVCVVGCYAQTAPQELEKVEGVNLVLGTKDRAQIVEMVENYKVENGVESHVSDIMKERLFEPLSIQKLANRTRAYLKIQDGCSQFCSYCIIPYARGPVRSLPLEVAVAQTRQLREEGYKEIVITGIEISSWGHDLKNGQSLIDLLEAVSAEAGEMRLRLGSLEPRTITEDFCRRAVKLPNLCPHFHLSMQSGCDETLRRMNRKYDSARYKKSVELLNVYFDRPAITTDLIVGFPGETEEEFARTLEHIRFCGFAEMHIFPYSIRTGTPAAEMEQVPKAVKEERAARAAAVAAEMRSAYLEGCVGKVYPVLYEQTYDGLWHGHAPNYATVAVSCGEDLHNRVVMTKVTGVEDGVLVGEVVFK